MTLSLLVPERLGSKDTQGEVFLQGSGADWNSAGDFAAGLPGGDAETATPSRVLTGFKVGGPLDRDKAHYFVAAEYQASDDVLTYTGIDRDGQVGGLFLAPNRGTNVFLRTDFNLGAANTLMVRVSGDDRTASGVNVGGIFTPEAGFTISEEDVQLAASLTTILSRRTINELRLLAGRSSLSQQGNSSRPGVERPSGIFGGNNLNTQDRDEDRLQLAETLGWTLARHNVKFGPDVLSTKTHINTRFNPNGNFLYGTDDPFEPS